MVLLVANALQPAMTGADQSVLGGAIILATIFVLNRVVAEARIPVVRRLLEFKPTTIGRDGNWITTEFARQGIDLGDAEADVPCEPPRVTHCHDVCAVTGRDSVLGRSYAQP